MGKVEFAKANIDWSTFTNETRVFIIDTEVLLHYDHPSPIEFYKDDWVIVGIRSITELGRIREGKTQRSDARTRSEAKSVIGLINKYRKKGNLRDGVSTGKGMFLVDNDDELWTEVPESIQEDKNANALIAIAKGWKHKIQELQHIPNVTIVSNDTALGIKADACSIAVETYGLSDLVDVDDLPTGTLQIDLKDEEQKLPDSFYKGKALNVDDLPKSLSDKELIPNEFVYFVDSNGKRLAIGNYQADERQIVHVPFQRPKTLPKPGDPIKPRNPEQACLVWLLLDPKTIFITIVARAGAGKTHLSMFAALSQFWGTNQSLCKYEKIVVFDPTCEAGDSDRKLGFRTGPLEEKMAPFSAHIEEAFIQIWASIHGVRKGWEEEAEAELNRMKAAHTFEVRPISFARGDSIRNAFIIVEEAQNLRRRDIQLVITRVARGSKIVLEGDLSQIDDPDIDFRSSGLTKAVQVFLGRKFGDEGIAGHITLIESERSALVAVANDIM